MTAIAYKDRVMACDSCWSDKGCISSLARKIVKLKHGALLGQAGDNDAREVLELLRNVKTPAQLPSRNALMATRVDYDGLIVFPSGRIFRVAASNKLHESIEDEDVGVWEVSGRPYAVIGSGGDIALGAMAAGRSARQAIALACRLHIECRLPVHSINL